MITFTFAVIFAALAVLSFACGAMYAADPLPAYVVAILFVVAAGLFVAQMLSERTEYAVPPVVK